MLQTLGGLVTRREQHTEDVTAAQCSGTPASYLITHHSVLWVKERHVTGVMHWPAFPRRAVQQTAMAQINWEQNHYKENKKRKMTISYASVVFPASPAAPSGSYIVCLGPMVRHIALLRASALQRHVLLEEEWKVTLPCSVLLLLRKRWYLIGNRRTMKNFIFTTDAVGEKFQYKYK